VKDAGELARSEVVKCKERCCTLYVHNRLCIVHSSFAFKMGSPVSTSVSGRPRVTNGYIFQHVGDAWLED
jgi:hypothetical protein